MTLTVGDKVIYPAQGLCVIGAIVNKIVADRPIEFYHLTFLDDRGGELFVPVDKVQAIGIRPLLKISEILELLGQLKKTAVITKDWKQRAIENSKLLASGSAFDAAKVARSLTALRATKTLSPPENQALERARNFLVREVSEVMQETRSAAEQRVDLALSAGKIERADQKTGLSAEVQVTGASLN
jgi:RNA polymerase-interacting CarD/CdnL/TRCF family regulator